MKPESTRLRFLRSTDLSGLMNAIESLPFKVELKGNPVKDGSRWVVFFVLPENPGINLESSDI